MKIGQTIVSEREKAVSESERMALRDKEKKRKRLSIAIYFAVIILVIVVIAAVAVTIAHERGKSEIAVDTTEYKPTVEIIDEGGSNYITDKMKVFVGKIEKDFYEYGYAVEKVIIPADKTREVDIYILGRGEFYKCHLDRSPAESAEDADRMIRYLDERDIKPAYVDIRVAGRAYFK